MPTKGPPTQQFHRELHPGRRAPREVVREARETLAKLPREARTFGFCQELAQRLQMNGQVVWKYAQGLGAPPRNGRRASRILSHEQVLEAERRLIAGEQLSTVAAALGTYSTTLRNRLDRLDEEREDHAVAEGQARAQPPFSGPNVYQPESFRALTIAELTIGKARPRATESRPLDIPAPSP